MGKWFQEYSSFQTPPYVFRQYLLGRAVHLSSIIPRYISALLLYDLRFRAFCRHGFFIHFR